MRSRGTPTRYSGVIHIGGKDYVIRTTTTDRRTGRKKEAERILRGVNINEAVRQRALLTGELQQASEPTKRQRVGEFARSWMASRALRLDATTAKTYAKALDDRILPALGDYYYDTLTTRDVQAWVDDMIRNGWSTTKRVRTKAGKSGRPMRPEDRPKYAMVTVKHTYTRNAINVWFRVFRTMTRDAMAELDLQRDPTLRVQLPPAAYGGDESKALTPEELTRFLAAFRAHPQHYPLVMLLAYTGLRHCHASALTWEDWDEATGIIRVVRKQVGGKVGPVSRKKRAPTEYPVEAELAEVLREHRRGQHGDVDPKTITGWMFPSRAGSLRTPNSMDKAWEKALAVAKITKRFTLHGLRYTFTDLVRRANVDAVVRRALTGHVTSEMQQHYSSVGLDEKRAAISGVARVMAAVMTMSPSPQSGGSGGGSIVPPT